MDTELISNRCPKCHAPLPADAPQGLCPKCLFAAVATPTEAGQPDGPRATPPPLDEIALAFPQLEILEFIGQGGMGFVFKARQPKLDRLVALKILPQSLAADPTFAERFHREAKLLARLNHPGIVTVHDFGSVGFESAFAAFDSEKEKGGKGEEENKPSAAGFSSAPSPLFPSAAQSQTPDARPHPQFYYLLMEFVDGVNLRQAMQAGRFTPEQALAIVPKICEALQFAHNEGILHRDIKPENILLDAKGRVKIADFGIAKLVAAVCDRREVDDEDLRRSQTAATENLTEVGKSLGTPNYMAPEQLESAGDVDQRADIYSLGVVFYEMLTGELPTGRFAPPSQKSAADPRVDEVVLRALQKEKAKRYATAEEVRTQVETIATTPNSGSSRGDEAQTASLRLPESLKKPLAGLLFGIACFIVVRTIPKLSVALVAVKAALASWPGAIIVGLWLGTWVVISQLGWRWLNGWLVSVGYGEDMPSKNPSDRSLRLAITSLYRILSVSIGLTFLTSSGVATAAVTGLLMSGMAGKLLCSALGGLVVALVIWTIRATRTLQAGIATGSSLETSAATNQEVSVPSNKAILFKSAAVAVIVGLAVFAIIAAAASLTPPQFTASARIKLMTDGTINLDPYQLQNEFARIESPEFLAVVGEEANLRQRWKAILFGNQTAQDRVIAGQLRSFLDLKPIRNTAFVEIRYRSSSPSEAADIANTIAEVYCRQGKAVLMDRAVEPTWRDTPTNPYLNLAAGVLAGGITGLLTACVMLLLRRAKRRAESATYPAVSLQIAGWLFIIIGSWSLMAMLFRSSVFVTILPSAFGLPLGVGLLRGREWCRRLATWSLLLSFIVTICICGWVVGKAFGLFPHLNLVAMFLGRRASDSAGAVSLFIVLLAQCIIYPWLYLTLIRRSVISHFAKPKQTGPWLEWLLTLAIVLLAITGIHVPVKHNWQTGIIFANPIFANPPKVPTGIEANSSAQASFGPVIELEVDMATPGGYDLDNGRFNRVSVEEIKSDSTQTRWSQLHGNDLIVLRPDGTNTAHISGLMFVDMKPAEVAESFWHKPATELLGHSNFTSMLKGTAEQAASTESKVWWWESRKPRDETDKPTYLFKTREGTSGLLQITGFTENPHGVKIRYKLVQQPNAASTP